MEQLKKFFRFLGFGRLKVKTGSVHVCADCGTDFWVTSMESRVLVQHDLAFPKRCRMCIKYGKSRVTAEVELPRVANR